MIRNATTRGVELEDGRSEIVEIDLKISVV